jgi:hypothetical protein
MVAMFVDGSGQNEQSLERCHRQFLFLIGRFLKIFSSETAWRNEPKLGRKHPWKLAKQFQNRRFFQIGQSETIIAYGGHFC